MGAPFGRVVGAFALAIAVAPSAVAEPAAVQWRPAEISFTAASAPPSPASVLFSATFTGPGGARYDVPGFWDGGSTWKVRFAPPVPGAWSYETRCEASDDRVTKTQVRTIATVPDGLAGRRGQLAAGPASGDNPLFKHGGILRVSENKRYMDCANGAGLVPVVGMAFHTSGR